MTCHCSGSSGLRMTFKIAAELAASRVWTLWLLPSRAYTSLYWHGFTLRTKWKRANVGVNLNLWFSGNCTWTRLPRKKGRSHSNTQCGRRRRHSLLNIYSLPPPMKNRRVSPIRRLLLRVNIIKINAGRFLSASVDCNNHLTLFQVHYVSGGLFLMRARARLFKWWNIRLIRSYFEWKTNKHNHKSQIL